MFTRSVTRNIIKIVAIAAIASLIIGYALWRSMNYTRGPSITITTPAHGSTISTTTVEIRGEAERINNLSINGSPIAIDEQGHFAEVRIVFKGINIFSLEGEDQFGRKVRRELYIVGM